MVLYTDGVVEAKHHQTPGEEYGYDRLRQFVDAHSNQELSTVADLLVEDLHRFAGPNVQNDDFTFLLLRFK